MPNHLQVALAVLLILGVATEANEVNLLGPRGFPRVAEEKPIVGTFHLPAIADFLAKHAIFIANAVATGREAPGGQGIKIAGSQASQAAIA